ncbi:MAG: toxin HipA [bacterium]|nr:toxin HipA [bacterium]
MRKAEVFVQGSRAGILQEFEIGKSYTFAYNEGYAGFPVSLTMPVKQETYDFTSFPPFFEGLLPEGVQLEGLLRINKIDRYDFFSQLVSVGADMVGAVTVREVL